MLGGDVLHHPENTLQLQQMLIEEWVLLPQEMLHQLVLSMRRSSFANPTPLAHADTSRDVLPRGGTSQLHKSFANLH
ncbi:hypothetical protein TNCV_2555551 [Trichonephila clavipes]|nr:hypothetical protein TNCV_2555551 [Trichonephila clavipes]